MPLPLESIPRQLQACFFSGERKLAPVIGPLLSPALRFSCKERSV